MSSFSFRFNVISSVKYLLYAALAGFVLTIGIAALKIFNVALLMAIIFVPILIGTWFFIKKGQGQDQIVLDDTGFTSSFFGRINYGEIESIPAKPWLGAPAPSLKIILKSGRNIKWGLSDSGSIFNDSNDTVVFRAFIDDLHLHLERQSKRSTTRKDQKFSAQQKDVAINPVEKIRKKYNKEAVLLPVGLLFGILIFIKTCGLDLVIKNEDKELKEIFKNSNLRYRKNIETSKKVLGSFARTLGPVYLYSNDKDIEVMLMPVIKEENGLDAVPALKHVLTSAALEKFIKHPDSASFITVLLNKNNELFAMRKSMMNHGDSTDTFLFLRFYDPNQKINPSPSASGKPVDSSRFVPLDITTGISVKKGQSISESLENSIVSLKMMLAQSKLRPSFRIYLTGATYNHVSKKLFDETVTVLKKKLVQAAVDTSLFHTTVHNYK